MNRNILGIEGADRITNEKEKVQVVIHTRSTETLWLNYSNQSEEDDFDVP